MLKIRNSKKISASSKRSIKYLRTKNFNLDIVVPGTGMKIVQQRPSKLSFADVKMGVYAGNNVVSARRSHAMMGATPSGIVNNKACVVTVDVDPSTKRYEANMRKLNEQKRAYEKTHGLTKRQLLEKEEAFLKVSRLWE